MYDLCFQRRGVAEGLFGCHVCYPVTSSINDFIAVAMSNQNTSDESNKGNNTNNTEDSPEVALQTAEASDAM